MNFKDTKAKCRHLKKLEKGLCGRCLFRVYRLEIHSVMLVYFRSSCMNCCPSNLLSGSSLPPLIPSLCEQVYSTQCVRGGGGCGVLLETIFCRILTLCIWPDSEPKKLLDHPNQEPRKEGGLRLINTFRKIPLQVNFLGWRQFSLLSV